MAGPRGPSGDRDTRGCIVRSRPVVGVCTRVSGVLRECGSTRCGTLCACEPCRGTALPPGVAREAREMGQRSRASSAATQAVARRVRPSCVAADGRRVRLDARTRWHKTSSAYDGKPTGADCSAASWPSGTVRLARIGRGCRVTEGAVR